MPSVTIMNQIVTDVTALYTDDELIEGMHVYLSPKITPLKSMSRFEIQVIEGGVEIVDHTGSVRREQFNLIIGLFLRVRKDHGDRHGRALADIAESIFVYKATLIADLDGSFVPKNAVELLVRPLALISESPVYSVGSIDEILIKEIHFVGGLNVSLL